MPRITRKRNYINKKKSVKRKIMKGGGGLKDFIKSIVSDKDKKKAESNYKNIFDAAKQLKNKSDKEKKDFITKLKDGIDPTTNKIIEKNAKQIVKQIELEGIKKNLGDVIDAYPKPVCGGKTKVECPEGFKQITLLGGGVWKYVKNSVKGALFLYIIAKVVDMAGIDI